MIAAPSGKTPHEKLKPHCDDKVPAAFIGTPPGVAFQ
jgi:hypothetical protein